MDVRVSLEARLRAVALNRADLPGMARRLALGEAGEPVGLLCFREFGRHALTGAACDEGHDIVYLFEDGEVADLGVLEARCGTSVRPRVPVRWALQVKAGSVARLGLHVGDRCELDRPLPDTLPWPSVMLAPEPRSEAESWPGSGLIARYAAREHLYASTRFAAGATRLPWEFCLGPRGESLWRHAGGAYVIAPRIVDLAALRALGADLGLAWLRLELLPTCEVRVGKTRLTLNFDPQSPDVWVETWRELGLFPTVGRWLMTRTLLVDLSGLTDTAFQRLPTRIRYDIRAANRRVGAGELAFGTVPAHRLDDRQWRAIEALHARWLDLHPGAEDNLTFCRPLVAPFGESMVAHLLWRLEAGEPVELLAVQLHVLWDRTNYYLFSETLPHAPNGSVHALIWHGALHAMERGADLLDLVSAFDPRYPAFRSHGQNYTPMKLRWHPTSVWMPPSVAIPLSEMPP